MSNAETKTVLTVIFRDDSPLINCNDKSTFRSVHIHLDPYQLEMAQPRHDQEKVSVCFIEDVPKPYRE